MADAPISESAARASFDAGSISDASRAEFTRIMAARGLDASDTLAKHGVVEQVPAPAPEPRPAMQPDLDHAKLPRLTSTELEIAADTLAKNWTGDPAVLDAALRNAGLELVDDGTDGRTDVERDFDRTLGAPASPDDYDLGSLLVNRTDLGPDGAVEVATAVRGALAEMAIPKHLGSALGNAILDAVERSNETPGVENAQRSNEQVALACRIVGVGREELLATVRPVLARLGPDGKELIQRAVAGGHDANLLVYLFRAAELGLVRAGLKANRG